MAPTIEASLKTPVRPVATWVAASAAFILTAAFIWSYWNVFRLFTQDWHLSDDYSHGYLVVPIALYLAIERRDRLAAATIRPALIGLVLLLVSLVALTVGTIGSQFLARLSMLGSISGIILFLCGWQYLRILAFPIAFLLFMIPLPGVIFTPLTFSLQQMSSSLAASMLSAVNIPVFREGNVLRLSHMDLNVAEACSGIRSLVSLTMMTMVYGQYAETSRVQRWIVIALGVPVAIVANALRVAGTGMVARYSSVPEGWQFFHTYSGYVVFLTALLLVYTAHRSMRWISARVPRLKILRTA